MNYAEFSMGAGESDCGKGTSRSETKSQLPP